MRKNAATSGRQFAFMPLGQPHPVHANDAGIAARALVDHDCGRALSELATGCNGITGRIAGEREDGGERQHTHAARAQARCCSGRLDGQLCPNPETM